VTEWIDINMIVEVHPGIAVGLHGPANAQARAKGTHIDSIQEGLKLSWLKSSKRLLEK